jgi:hypothetical protein
MKKIFIKSNSNLSNNKIGHIERGLRKELSKAQTIYLSTELEKYKDINISFDMTDKGRKKPSR